MAYGLPQDIRAQRVLIMVLTLSSYVWVALYHNTLVASSAALYKRDKLITYESETSKQTPNDPFQAKSSSKNQDLELRHRTDEGAVLEPQTSPNLLIVFWTPFWQRREAWGQVVKNRCQLKQMGCPTWKCDFVWKWEEAVARAPEAAAFVFFGLDFYRVPPPPRDPRQLWIWMDREAPPISSIATASWAMAEKENHFFNLSMSYHRLNDIIMHDGDFVPLSAPEGLPHEPNFFLNQSTDTFQSYKAHMEKFDNQIKEHHQVIDSWLIERSRMNRERNFSKNWRHKNETFSAKVPGRVNNTVEEERITRTIHWLEDLTEEEIAWAGRPKLAAWMASHCPTDSRRESIVAALQMYFEVTTIGKCGKLSCGRNHEDTHCYTWLASSHLFYLAFENTLCEDYVTEKLWRPMQFGMVPIVYGGTRYSDILPFGSFINAADFKSAGDLARYLVYLGNHPSHYLRYLQWRKFWRMRWPSPWCHLCSRIHQQRATSTPSVVTLDSWWNSTATCYQPLDW